ncbi:MAG: hypothetical protein ACXVVQ_11395 [Solirubrobacteraceae bacterium]
MSKGKRARRPGGHPAKVAVRREREAASGSGAPVGPDGVVRRIVREVSALTGALDAELWASHLLGVFWDQRYTLSLDQAASPDYSLILGEPLIEAVARFGGAGARTTLRVIERVDDGELGLRAAELAASCGAGGGEEMPSWVSNVGEAEITGAAVMYEDVFDDASTVFLEAVHPGGETHAVGVLIDNNLGGMAKDVLLADSIDRVAEVMRKHPRRDGELRLERIEPGVAAGRIHAAVELTDMTLDPPVAEDYARLRSMALLRADEAPHYKPVPERAEMPHHERDWLRDEFLSSPEGEQFAPDSDEAFAASLAIDFCADYVDGRPLRWSPVVVELFMAGWIPRKVLAGPELYDALPPALDAWVRFAGRKSGTPEWAVDETRNAIPRWCDEMVRSGNDPAAGGPAKQFLTAAKAAGVDVEDGDGLEKFMAGWNARGGAL